MSAIAELDYPDTEKPFLEQQGSLLEEWQDHIGKYPVKFEDYEAKHFVYDGFFPHYFSQEIKVLFIGREAIDQSGQNYLEFLHRNYTRPKKEIGKHSLNRSKFHRRLFYVAYSLNHGFCSWDDIPYAEKLGDTFATADGLSFALMNVSKFSNDSGGWQMNRPLVDHFIAASGGTRNFFREQVELLSPHVVVSMDTPLGLEALGEIRPLDVQNEFIHAYRLSLRSSSALLLNTFHFSAFRKKTRTTSSTRSSPWFRAIAMRLVFEPRVECSPSLNSGPFTGSDFKGDEKEGVA